MSNNNIDFKHVTDLFGANGEMTRIQVVNYNGGNVVPPHFFNEANLLNCLARMVLHINSNKLPGLVFLEEQFSEHGVQLIMDGNSGCFHLANYLFVLADGRDVAIGLNCKSLSLYPVYFYDEDHKTFPCLNENGDVSMELMQFLKRMGYE